MLIVDSVTKKYGDLVAVNDLSFEVKDGEIFGLLGLNGAGKTTLVKLLLRLYDVKNGSIKLNDINYKELKSKDIRKKIGAVFQNPEVYSLSIAENVLLKRIETEEERNLVIESLKFADIYDCLTIFLRCSRRPYFSICNV